MPRVVRVPFLIPNWAAAQVLFPNVIFVKRQYASNVRLIAHELTHVDQIKRFGLLRYWVRYLRLLVRHGYRNHPMEIEAWGLESNPVQLARARLVIDSG